MAASHNLAIALLSKAMIDDLTEFNVYLAH